jgi:hypothetical protein
MADSDLGRRPRERAVLLGLAGAAVVGVTAIILGLRPPPQMGPDRDVFMTVDALFTAVTARDVGRLADCAGRLRAYRESGRLPSVAADELDSIIAKAQSGSWDKAAIRLYEFMKGQRREERGRRQ